MSPDDFVYGFLLVVSIFMGFALRNIQSPRLKQTVASLVGFVMVVFVCGWNALHSVVTIFVNLLLVKLFSPRRCHIASFVWCFGYLMFFRTTHLLGLPKVPSYSNAVQLLLTLKLVGLAFEIHDSDKIRKEYNDQPEDVQTQLKMEYESVKPSTWDTIMYSYCYIGLLTGPYYKYRTYHDMIWQKNTKEIPWWPFLQERLRILPFFVLGLIVVSHYFPVNYALTEEFYAEHTTLYRLWFMVTMFFQFRMRIYTAWLLSEALCITSGLGAYPSLSKPRNGGGPSVLQVLKDIENEKPSEIIYDFETIHNIDPYSCDFKLTVREGMKAWNMSVQWWLANYIYKRVPIRSLRVTITMMVSAYWHGIHPGYYLSFLTVPSYLWVESNMIKTFRDPAGPTGRKIVDFVAWFMKMRAFEYMSIGFLLLSYRGTIDYWISIGFFLHIYMVLCAIAILIFRPKKTDKQKDS